MGDVLPPDHHAVDREVMVTNVDSLPAVRLVGVVQAVAGSDTAYVVTQNTPLYLGYKFNSFGLYAMPASLLDSLGGPDGIDFDALAQSSEPASIVSLAAAVVSNEYALDHEEYYYRISAVSDSTVTVTLTRRVLRFSDGTADQIITY